MYRPPLPWEEPTPVARVPEFSSPYDLLIKNLNSKLLQFLEKVNKKLATADLDNEASIGTFFAAIDASDGEYSRILSGYIRVAPYCLVALLEALVDWRATAISSTASTIASNRRMSVMVEEKYSLVSDYLFANLTIRSLKCKPADQLLPIGLADRLIDISFTASTLMGQKPKESSEFLLASRSLVADGFAEVVGALSEERFKVVTSMLLDRLAKSQERISDVVAFTSASRFISMDCEDLCLNSYEASSPVSSSENLAASQQFLQALAQSIKEKGKSEISAAVCKLIGSVLLPLADQRESNGLSLAEWREEISALWEKHRKLSKKFKDSSAALLFEIGILCTGTLGTLFQNPLAIIDRLCKFIKEKRELVLELTFYLLLALVVNDYEEAGMDQILAKIDREVFPAPSRKAAATDYNCVNLIVDIVSVISVARLDYVIEAILIPFLNTADVNYERIITGLLSFNQIADRLFISFDKSQLALDSKTTLLDTSSRNRKAALYRYHKSSRPLVLHQELLHDFRKALEQVFVYVDAQVGCYLTYTSARPSTDKQPLLEILRTAITTIRRTPPTTYSMSQLMGLLAKYTCHIDGEIRAEALDVLNNLMCRRPSIRNDIAIELGKLALSIPHNQHESIVRVISMLRDILGVWIEPSVLSRLDPDPDTDAMRLRPFVASELDAIVLLLMCSPHSGVRSNAFKLLPLIHRLNLVMPEGFTDKRTRLYTILQQQSRTIIRNARAHFTDMRTGLEERSDTNLYSTIEDLCSQVSEDTQEREMQKGWASVLGAIVRAGSNSDCARALSCAYTLTSEKLESLQNQVMGIKQGATKVVSREANDLFIIWRNYITVACGVGDCDAENIFAQANPIKALELNIERVLSIVLPALLHPIQAARDALQLALSYCRRPHAYCLPDLLAKTKSRDKRELRFEAAHIYRMLLENEGSAYIINSPALLKSYFEFIEETVAFLQVSTTDFQPSTQFLRYDFLRVVTHLLPDLFLSDECSLITPELHATLLALALRLCGYGHLASTASRRETDHRDRSREVVERTNTRDDRAIQEQDTIEYWATQAIVSLLRAPSTMYTDQSVFQETGPVIIWATDVFERCADEQVIALTRVALKVFISNNIDKQEKLFCTCVNKSFLPSGGVSDGYFITIVDIITAGLDVTYTLAMLLNLALYKLGDMSDQVRKHAINLVHWMSLRFFRTQQATARLAKMSQCPERYQRQLYDISELFSEKHPEIRLDLLQQVMQRVARQDVDGQRRMIQYTTAWLSRIDLGELEPGSLKTTLEHLMVLTQKSYGERSDLLERLFSFLAEKEGNVERIIKFMVNAIQETQHTPLIEVFRTVAVFLGRVQPQLTVDHLIQELRTSDSDMSPRPDPNTTQFVPPNPMSWTFNKLFPLSDVEQPLSRSDFALIILAEMVLEDGCTLACEKHIPVLLQSALVSMDHTNALVNKHTKLLVLDLVFKLTIDYIKETSAEMKALKAIERLIDESGSQALWKNEQISSYKLTIDSTEQLSSFVKMILAAMRSSYSSLTSEWGSEALQWAINPHSNLHMASRSFQIFRALNPPASEDAVKQLLARQCTHLQSRSANPSQSLTISIEIAETLQALIKSSSAPVLGNLPHLFWGACAMLETNVAEEYICYVKLLCHYQSKVDINNAITQHSLLSIQPTERPFSGVIPLVLKGMAYPASEKYSRQLLAWFSTWPEPISGILGSDVAQRTLTITLGLLPHLITVMGREDTFDIASMLSLGVGRAGYSKMATLFADYSKYALSPEGIRRFLHEISATLATAFFPQFELSTFTILIQMLEHGQSIHSKSIMNLMEVLLGFVNLKESALNQQGVSLFGPITKHLDSELWESAFAVIEAVISKSEHEPFSISAASDINVLSRISEFQRTPAHFGPHLGESAITRMVVSLKGTISAVVKIDYGRLNRETTHVDIKRFAATAPPKPKDFFGIDITSALFLDEDEEEDENGPAWLDQKSSTLSFLSSSVGSHRQLSDRGAKASGSFDSASSVNRGNVSHPARAGDAGARSPAWYAAETLRGNRVAPFGTRAAGTPDSVTPERAASPTVPAPASTAKTPPAASSAAINIGSSASTSASGNSSSANSTTPPSSDTVGASKPADRTGGRASPLRQSQTIRKGFGFSGDDSDDEEEDDVVISESFVATQQPLRISQRRSIIRGSGGGGSASSGGVSASGSSMHYGRGRGRGSIRGYATIGVPSRPVSIVRPGPSVVPTTTAAAATTTTATSGAAPSSEGVVAPAATTANGSVGVLGSRVKAATPERVASPPVTSVTLNSRVHHPPGGSSPQPSVPRVPTDMAPAIPQSSSAGSTVVASPHRALASTSPPGAGGATFVPAEVSSTPGTAAAGRGGVAPAAGARGRPAIRRGAGPGRGVAVGARGRATPLLGMPGSAPALASVRDGASSPSHSPISSPSSGPPSSPARLSDTQLAGALVSDPRATRTNSQPTIERSTSASTLKRRGAFLNQGRPT